MFKFNTNRNGRIFPLAYLDMIVLNYYNLSVYICDGLKLKLTGLSYKLIQVVQRLTFDIKHKT